MTQVSLPCAYACSRGVRNRMPIHTGVGLLSTSISIASKHGRVGLTKTAAWKDARHNSGRLVSEAEAQAAGYWVAGHCP